VADVEHAAALAHRLVLGGDAGRVLHRHLEAGERDELGAEGAVPVVERRAPERRGGRRGGVAVEGVGRGGGGRHRLVRRGWETGAARPM
jgi:hypothetical protein